MRHNLKCPGCQAPMTFWAYVKAPTPFHLRCGKCNERIILGSNILAWVIVLAALSIAAFIVMSGVFNDLHTILYLVFILICGLLFEVMVFSLFKALDLSLELSRKK